MNERASDQGAQPGKLHSNRTVLRDEVGEFCEDLTEHYQGWLVAVLNQGEDGQWHVVADQQPLQAVSYQAGDGRFDIRIVLGKDPGETFAHVVPGVQALDFTTAGGAPDELSMRAADGLTAVRFRSPAKTGTGQGR